MRILGLIPARGGSKGVPRKNIKLLHDKELIRYSIETGLSCPLIDQLVVSTEDPEIADISRLAGASVPFMRPSELASDQSPSIDTIAHCLRYFEEKRDPFHAICLLQPTVPFRNIGDLSAAIEQFISTQADSLISVREVPHIYHPNWVYELKEGAFFLKSALDNKPIISRRQELPKAFHRDGSVYITKKKIVLEQNSLYGDKISYHIMANSPNINIDTKEDWQKAEDWIKKGIAKYR